MFELMNQRYIPYIRKSSLFGKIFFYLFSGLGLHGIYNRIYICPMTNDEALYIKIPGKLKTHATKYAKPKGGLSKLVRDLLIKETKFKDNQ